MSVGRPHTPVLVTTMRNSPWRAFAALAIITGVVALVLWVVSLQSTEPILSSAICQPGDLGELYHASGRPPHLTKPYLALEEPVVVSYTVELLDIQLTNTVLECAIVRYTDKTAAQHALEKICLNQAEPARPEVGNAACHFVGPAPRNLAFRRDAYLVLMNGDITRFPAAQVDERLR